MLMTKVMAYYDALTLRIIGDSHYKQYSCLSRYARIYRSNATSLLISILIQLCTMASDDIVWIFLGPEVI